ncbi:2-amino-4-hydroxy-6-hydroxymethyldihydropteridine diphosphokinase [Geitlerinema splendidum]|nr:2-amino-4-hydroxy-6-hydroxymethyldihydropteridine diphosphokinase [Geitlerinema splendidum]
MVHQVAIALGSNLGDSLTILTDAIARLKQMPGVILQRQSSWYHTPPVGPPQPSYINGCAVLEVAWSPVELLERLLDLEAQFGRVRLEKHGPRTLDLDILLVDDLILDLPQLQVPHPRMRERAFVLVPLAEIAPNWTDPVTGRAIAHLREAVDCTGVTPLTLYDPGLRTPRTD